MSDVLWMWALMSGVILIFSGVLGLRVRNSVFGVLVDSRGRYSLANLQVFLWSVLVLSLIAAVVAARIAEGSLSSALEFSIPNELLIVMGISIGSTATASAIKAGKDRSHPELIAASNSLDRPHFSQMFLVEEGALADQVIDVTKFQNFWLTLVLVGTYVALTVAHLDQVEEISDLKQLPGFQATFTTLLAISHAGYLAGKLPTPPGQPQGLNVLMMRNPDLLAAEPPPPSPKTAFVPRNPA